jgi:hypothetical protein
MNYIEVSTTDNTISRHSSASSFIITCFFVTGHTPGKTDAHLEMKGEFI